MTLRPRDLAAMLIALVVLGGCERRATLVQRTDSTTVVTPDEFVARVRELHAAWDAPDSGAVAARLTAALLLDDLNMQAVSGGRFDWAERARALLDSIDVGAEFAAAPCVLVVNFFDRGNPSGGSWPWVFNCGETRLRASPVSGQGLALQAVASRGLFGEPPKPPGPAGFAALFARRSTGGNQPLLMVHRPNRQDTWDVAQTLGPDSLGGWGSGAFEVQGDSVDLETRTFGPNARFEECATCPHVFRIHRFRWRKDGFQRIADRDVPSPYATFVRLIQALTAGDLAAATPLLADPLLIDEARLAGWDVARGSWRAAPATDESAHELVFFRGMREAWSVTFEPRGQDWVIAGFRPVNRSIE